LSPPGRSGNFLVYSTPVAGAITINFTSPIVHGSGFFFWDSKRFKEKRMLDRRTGMDTLG
jgi:hypothetical protein